jgi:dTDP-4-amino-4,6-dideoxygalactose transaminase
MKDEIDAAIQAVVSTASFIGGAPVEAFEQSFAEFIEVPHCIGVGNGTDAIEIALDAFDLPRGGEVIVPAASFIATSEAVSRSGLNVVFADIDPESYTMDPDDVARRVTGRTVALLPVHLYGHPAAMPELESIAERHGLKIVEDAAQAHGARVGGRRVGSIGTVGTFSFYPGKNLGAYGDAGAITTSDAALATQMRMQANHGRTTKYEHQFEGRNSRIDALQAAVLSVKLRYIDVWTERRRSLAALYREGLAGVGDVILPLEKDGYRHVYHLFVIRTKEREWLRQYLQERGIATGIHYPHPLSRLEAYAEHPQYKEPFKAEVIANEVLSLPMGDSIDAEQVASVVDAVQEFFGR